MNKVHMKKFFNWLISEIVYVTVITLIILSLYAIAFFITPLS